MVATPTCRGRGAPMATPLSRNCTVPPAEPTRLAETVAVSTTVLPRLTGEAEEAFTDSVVSALPTVSGKVVDLEPVKFALSPE